jgi:hypothetical protein
MHKPFQRLKVTEGMDSSKATRYHGVCFIIYFVMLYIDIELYTYLNIVMLPFLFFFFFFFFFSLSKILTLLAIDTHSHFIISPSYATPLELKSVLSTLECLVLDESTT